MAKDIFYLYKFSNNREIAELYAELIQELLVNIDKDFVIVPSPWSKSRKKEKGWNQIEEITTILQKKYDYRLLNCLKKEKGVDQKKLNKEQRLNNMKKRITKLKNAPGINKQNVILIDDIFTTGATVNECSRILKKCGAREVTAMTIAQD